jgi:hypothetical protein
MGAAVGRAGTVPRDDRVSGHLGGRRRGGFGKGLQCVGAGAVGGVQNRAEQPSENEQPIGNGERDSHKTSKSTTKNSLDYMKRYRYCSLVCDTALDEDFIHIFFLSFLICLFVYSVVSHSPVEISPRYLVM